jgi:transcriptional regulator with XRE-family HTH domain
MAPRKALAEAIKRARAYRGLTQEDFSVVSSRTYLSTLERGVKSPTIDKVDTIAKRLNVHPLTVLALSYASQGFRGDTEALLQKVADELRDIAQFESGETKD